MPSKKKAQPQPSKQRKQPRPNHQALKRISHLYTVARLMAGCGGPTGQILSRHHTDSLFTVSEKSQTRIPRTIRRAICRQCRLPLVNGVTATLRLRRNCSRGHFAIITCGQCQAYARYGFARHDWIEALRPPVTDAAVAAGK